MDRQIAIRAAPLVPAHAPLRRGRLPLAPLPQPQCLTRSLPEWVVLLNASAPSLTSFEPQLSPAVAVAAAFAAVPPLLFWVRIASNALKRQQELDRAQQELEKAEAERQERLRKLTGRGR